MKNIERKKAVRRFLGGWGTQKEMLGRSYACCWHRIYSILCTLLWNR